MTHTLPWQKPDPVKNYYPVPKVICQLGLSPGEIAVYSFLLFCEDRKTYQCYPSYRTIGDAVGMSRNTVCKYVRSLEEKGLIRTERTTAPRGDGRRASPRTAEAGSTGQRTLVFAPVSRCVASQEHGRVRIAAPEVWRDFGPLFGAPKAEQEKGIGAFPRQRPFTAARSADCHEGLRHFAIDADCQTPNGL